MRKNTWLILAILIIAAIIAFKVWPKSSETVAAMEPSSASAQEIVQEDEALPTPAHPLFKKDDPDKVTTIIPETPQANGINGAPKTLKTDLGLDVSPLCFEQLFGVDGPKGPIDVTTCEKSSGYLNIRTGFENGRFRSLYDYPPNPDAAEDAEDPSEPDLFSYEYIGDFKGGKAIVTYNETGGTGRSSNLILVNLTGNTLSLVDQIAVGDRCNGGLVEASSQNGKLVYSISVTPGDFPILAWGEDKGIKPFEDLEASAMSCFAVATFEDGTLSKISLIPDATTQQGADWTSQYAKQECFNKKFKMAIDSGKKDMTAPELKAFMDDFLASCSK